MRGTLKPEIAPFNKNPLNAGGWFGVVGCSAPSPCTGARSRNQAARLLCGITFSKTENRKIAVAILPIYFLGALRGLAPVEGVAEARKGWSVGGDFPLF